MVKFPEYSSAAGFELSQNIAYELPSISVKNVLEYEDGSTKTVTQGVPVMTTRATIQNLSNNVATNLYAWLMGRIGTDIQVVDPDGVVGSVKGTSTWTLMDASRSGGKAVTSSFDATNDINIVLKQDVASGASNIDYRVEIILNNWSVYVIGADLAALQAAQIPVGRLGFAKDTRKLYMSAPQDLVLQFPLKEQEVTYWITDGVLPTNVLEGDTVYDALTAKYYVANDKLVLVDTAYPSLAPWKVVVLDNASVGLLNGTLSWSSYNDSGSFKSGIIAKGGVTYPRKSAPFETGHGSETLDGFNVTLANSNRLQITSLEYSLVGSTAKSYLVYNGSSALQRTGKVSQVSFDAGMYKIEVEPKLWIDTDAVIPPQTAAETASANGETVPVTVGQWDDAAYTLVENLSGYVDLDGSRYCQAGIVTYYPTENNRTNIELRALSQGADSALSSIDKSVVYMVIAKTGKMYKLRSVYPISFGGNTTWYVDIQDYDMAYLELEKGDAIGFYTYRAIYACDTTSDITLADPLTVKIYDSTTKNYTEVPKGVFTKLSDGRLQVFPDPRDISLDGSGKVTINTYLKSTLQNESGETISPWFSALPYVAGDKTVTHVINNVKFPEDPGRYNYRGFTHIPLLASPKSQVDFEPDVDLGTLAVDKARAKYCWLGKNQAFYQWGDKLPHVLQPYVFGEVVTYSAAIGCESFSRSVSGASQLPLVWTQDGVGMLIAGTKGSTMKKGDVFTRWQEPASYTTLDKTTETLLRSENFANLATVFSYALTDEQKSQLVGRTTVDMYTNQTVACFQGEYSEGGVDFLDGDHCKFRGFYADASLEVWLRHKTNSNMDRLVCEKDFAAEAPRFDGEDVMVVRTKDHCSFDKTKPFPAEWWCQSSDSNNIYCLNNLPASLGGADFLSETDASTPWGMFFFKGDYEYMKDWFSDNRLFTVHDTSNGNDRYISYEVIKAQPVFIQNQPNGSRTWMMVQFMPISGNMDEIAILKKNSTVSNMAGWSYPNAVNLSSDAFRPAFKSGRESLRWTQAIVDEVLDKDSPTIDGYASVDFVWKFHHTYTGQEPDLTYKTVVVASPKSLYTVNGTGSEAGLWFNLMTEIDLSREIYVGATGRKDQNGTSSSNPRKIAESLMRTIDSRNTIDYAPDYADRENWPAHYQSKTTTTAQEVLSLLTTQTYSVLTYTPQDKMRLRSALISDQIGDEVARFDRTNIIKGSVQTTTTRDVKDLYSRFQVRYHTDPGQGKDIYSISESLASNGASVDISGLTARTGNSTALATAKTNESDNIKASTLESLQLAKAYYNSGTTKLLDVVCPWYYDSENKVNGVYPVHSPASLMTKIVPYHSFVGWTIGVSVDMDWMVNRATTGAPLALGDLVVINYPAIADIDIWALVTAISPDYYKGIVKLTLYTPMDPWAQQRIWDPLLDGGLVSVPGYSISDYVFKGYQYYPFSGSYVGTLADQGMGATLGSDTFIDGSYADWDQPYAPIEP